jgi:predicted metalloprotease with PDZ domain
MRRIPFVNALGILLLVGVCAVEFWRMQANTLLRQENAQLQGMLSVRHDTQAENDELRAQRDRLRWSQELHVHEAVNFRAQIQNLQERTNSLEQAVMAARYDTSIVVKRFEEEIATLKEELARKPRVPRIGGWMGVNIMGFRAEQTDGNVQTGVLLSSVLPNGPADRAGLERGDVILNLDGHAVVSVEDFKDILVQKMGGQSVAVDITRNNRALTAFVRILDWPQ